jgi:hypothetical protein
MRRLWLLFSQAVTVVLAIAFVVATLKPAWWQSGRIGASPPTAAPAAESMARSPRGGAVLPAVLAPAARGIAGSSFAAAVRRAAPAVVSITASKSTLRKGGQDAWQSTSSASQGSSLQTGLGSACSSRRRATCSRTITWSKGADDIEVTSVRRPSASAKARGDGRRFRSRPAQGLARWRVPVIPLGDMAQLSVGESGARHRQSRSTWARR